MTELFKDRFVAEKEEIVFVNRKNPSPKLTKQLDKIEDNVGDKK